MIRVRDNGADELIRALASGVNVRVGLIGDKAQAKHSGSKLTVAEIGAIHELGTDTIPQRSFIRATVDEEFGRSKTLLRRIAEDVVRWISPVASANRFGQKMVDMMRARIDANIPPPLAAATVKRKGNDLALVDTGQLRAALDYEVTRG